MKAAILFPLILLYGYTIKAQPEISQIEGLPYHITESRNDSQKALVFFISGDGGYTGFDQSICDEFAVRGYPVIGLDALKYFWKERDAPTVVIDVQNLLSYYKTIWHKSEFIFVGYSFGADAMPVIVNRFDNDFKIQTKIIGLLSPSTSADLEIHIGDMLSIRSKEGLYDTAAELNNLLFSKTVCIYGENEKEELKNKISNHDVKFLTVKGGHRYDSNFKQLAELVLQIK